MARHLVVHGRTHELRVEDELDQDVSGDARLTCLPVGQSDPAHLASARRRFALVGGDGVRDIQAWRHARDRL